MVFSKDPSAPHMKTLVLHILSNSEVWGPLRCAINVLITSIYTDTDILCVCLIKQLFYNKDILFICEHLANSIFSKKFYIYTLFNIEQLTTFLKILNLQRTLYIEVYQTTTKLIRTQYFFLNISLR